MSKHHLIIITLLLSGFCNAQTSSYSKDDQQAFTQKIKEIQDLNKLDMGQTVVEVGKSFRGTPYKSKTLEINNEESLVINLRGFDCTTYVENVMAFSLLLQKEVEDFLAHAPSAKKLQFSEHRSLTNCLTWTDRSVLKR